MRIKPNSFLDYTLCVLMILGIGGGCAAVIGVVTYGPLALMAWVYNTVSALINPTRQAITPWQALAVMLALGFSLALVRGLVRAVRKGE